MIEPMKISAVQIADALKLPRPTPQQQAVIEADLEPALVIAGAGSGKTETMANRVLWLLANGKVTAGHILGLTFTRKAAGELAVRIRERIEQLAAAGLVEGEYDPFEAPTVATYNSFSNRIYRDNAMLLGREADGTVLGEASAWQLARSLVIASTDDRLPALEKQVDSITKAVLALSHALSENLADPDEVRSYAARFARFAELPPGGRGAYEDAARLAAAVGSLDVLLGIAQAFDAAKASRGFVEYSDQVALALRLVRTVPRVREELLDQYRVVLLDEYQDTSSVQTWLLAELFAGHPVMAVGDPNQSIYGWRGASAANLEGYARQFGGGTIAQFNLTTSWRNGHTILAAANALVEPLVAETRVRVQRLEPGPNASDLPIDVSYSETVIDEANEAAEWLKQKLRQRDPKSGELPTAAMLFRARKTQTHFIAALRARDIPYHVLGIGGLMAEPEIADLVSALRVVSNPSAGNELVRLLAGSRWRLGVRDLHALRRLASWLQSRDYAQQPLDDDVRQQLRSSLADGESGSIVDALDFVATAKPGHGALSDISDIGIERLRDAGRTFARLRARSGLDLMDFVTVVEQELQLDIEVLANECRPLGGANREAFFDALGSYLAVDDSATLAGFLAWLREAEWRDGLAPRPEAAEPGTVQLLTIHGSKGLEWDLVVVPRVVEHELPGKSVDGSNGWLTFGALPWPFRGDAAELPVFEWETVTDRKSLLDRKAEFAEQVKHRHSLEERRLAYVAVTRARHSLLLTGSFWAGQTASRAPSEFLQQLSARGIVGELPVAPESEENPLGEDAASIEWPLDPLGERRRRVEQGAADVRSAVPRASGYFAAELELLLAERAARLAGGGTLELPARVPASRFKDFVTDPAAVAASLRRPMPERPYRATRLGTLFHSWVEDRYGIDGTTEQLDAMPTELDGDLVSLEQEQLEKLQRTFESSPWASRAPVDVEREIHLVLDGQVIICKIDAVYAIDSEPRAGAEPDPERYQVVDWKTGKAPKDAADLEEKQLQLALYRLAYACWKGIDPAMIDAVFYYVADDAIIVPERIFDEDELVALWRASLA
ncbi:MAG: UvrD-helicase domain-containing protein [Microbacteriaceae bacterium]